MKLKAIAMNRSVTAKSKATAGTGWVTLMVKANSKAMATTMKHLAMLMALYYET